MEMVNILSGALLVAVITIGLLLKRYTTKKLSEIEGLGEITTAQDAEGNTSL